MDDSKAIINYQGQSADVIEEQLTEEDAFLFMPPEQGFPFYITLVQNGDTTTINFTSLDKNLTIREFIHLCKRNGPISLSQNALPV
jgi:NRPS condensation-like uncharacterized protein